MTRQWPPQIFQRVSQFVMYANFVSVEMAPDASDSIIEQSDPSGMLEGLNDDIDND